VSNFGRYRFATLMRFLDLAATKDAVNFWAKIAIRYFVVALSALLLAIVVSFLAAASIEEKDNELAGFLALRNFVLLAPLLISASLGITAELIQRKFSCRPFAWPKALLRSALALPILFGLLLRSVANHWPMQPVVDAILLVMCAVSAYFALRIKRPFPLPPNLLTPESDGWWPTVRK
jgi:hypothetical protein